MDLESLFAPEGPLAKAVRGYEARPAQIKMALLVGEVFRRGGVLLAEAGTGTGKTLAYLIPALLAGKKVVVSTATKTLQGQILEKDVPLLSRVLGRRVSVAVLKGRQNYLCLRRFKKFRARPLFRFAAEASAYDRLERWAGATQTGDRAEVPDLPDDYGPWREVCSTAETCWGAKCHLEADCHVLRQRRAAQKAQVVVINHHLFFADLAVRAVSPGEVIPRYDAVVFDEAHHLESVATEYFGVQVSSYRTAELVRDGAAAARPAEKLPRALAKALQETEQAATAFWATLPRAPVRSRLRTTLGGKAAEKLSDLLGTLGHWADRIAPRQAESPETENLFRRTTELQRDLGRFAAEPEPGEVRWLETRGRGVFLQSAPVEVAPHLASALFSAEKPIVLTSATLRVGGSFAYLRDRLGVSETARELSVESPFDYASQGLLYVPQGMPDPNDGSFPARAAGEIAALLTTTRGRAFCLFTSHRVLRAVADALEGQLPFPLLVQGQAPREALLRTFQENTHSVLLGAQSFWEGVDVPGEALSAVIIDKVPFASPSDPLVEARIERIRSRGESPFAAYQLPSAAMTLRQGVGRLIRGAADRGLVAVLDRRLIGKPYGRLLLESLPPFPLTRNSSDVADFFRPPPVA